MGLPYMKINKAVRTYTKHNTNTSKELLKNDVFPIQHENRIQEHMYKYFNKNTHLSPN